jgi:hypothetical protein
VLSGGCGLCLIPSWSGLFAIFFVELTAFLQISVPPINPLVTRNSTQSSSDWSVPSSSSFSSSPRPGSVQGRRLLLLRLRQARLPAAAGTIRHGADGPGEHLHATNNTHLFSSVLLLFLLLLCQVQGQSIFIINCKVAGDGY